MKLQATGGRDAVNGALRANNLLDTLDTQLTDPDFPGDQAASK